MADLQQSAEVEEWRVMDNIPNVNIPAAQSNQWRVETFDVPKSDWGAFIYGHRTPKPGTYTRLMRGSIVVMSDTDAEKRDHSFAVHKANGHCLINGLGLGMVLGACLLKNSVTKVTVVEISADVINLVAHHYADARVEIIQSDALLYKPPKGVRYGMVWHDIWDNICADNLPQMHALHRKYGKRCDWQGSWARQECERVRG